MSELIEVIESTDDELRNRSLDSLCRERSIEWLRTQCNALDTYRRASDNLYFRVRALFFLSAIYRYHLPTRLSVNEGHVPFQAYAHLLHRRFSEAIDSFLDELSRVGYNDALCSSLAASYHDLAFQTLADQVRHSVRTFRGNRWMFRIGHPSDHPLRVRKELTIESRRIAPILRETTAVRMDLSHSAWSDIFFLGMDYPSGARVMNVSVNLAVRGRDEFPKPPIEAYLRVIDRPVLRLVSIDLGAQVELTQIDEVFDFARDYLGLLKAAVIAAGIVPPGLEGCGRSLAQLFEMQIGPGCGLEIVSSVNDIPKGSRLAVSTNLLGALIAVCMRATGQVSQLEGPLTENDRRTVAARAILGEWLGGSGGGWQDSGGVWPGIKMIRGVVAEEGDPEFGVSRGCLLPRHEVLKEDIISRETRRQLSECLVLVHGGMAQNVGPILEMVTEKYLLRSEAEWNARQEALGVMKEITAALRTGDIKRLGAATTANFFGPLQAIIPWCSDRFTETLIERCREVFAEQFWGFWMLGGMAGGGMGFIFAPEVKTSAQTWLLETMRELKSEFEKSLAFAMDPVVYDFDINEDGSCAELRCDDEAMLPDRYYAMAAPEWLRAETRSLSPMVRTELETFGARCRESGAQSATVQTFIEHVLPNIDVANGSQARLVDLLQEHGFDSEAHETIRSELKAGRIGLSQNRLPSNVQIEDVEPEDVIDTRRGLDRRFRERGERAIRDGEVGVVTLSAGVGSRWTEGAGVVKGLHPFCKFSGRHRNFIEVHLAKSQKTCRSYDVAMPHIVTTSYMTEAPLRDHLRQQNDYGYQGQLMVSPGRSIGLRMIPMVRDLTFAWEEMPQQILDEQQQKVRTSLRSALADWARSMGEGNDYTDNLPLQCMHPVGHWYEVPNLLRNGVLLQLLQQHPNLKYLMLHNIDTLGASVDPALLGLHIEHGHCLSFEVIARRLEDRGGGLARVNGQVRILEGLAIPREEDEFRLSFYNSMTTWIQLDRLLEVFELNREQLSDARRVNQAVRRIANLMPTYTTIKDVKKRWGHGQEDVYPVSQFEKLWSDMAGLAQVDAGFFVVPLVRGQQLKEQSQLDGWLRDKSAAYVDSLADWS